MCWLYIAILMIYCKYSGFYHFIVQEIKSPKIEVSRGLHSRGESVSLFSSFQNCQCPQLASPSPHNPSLCVHRDFSSVAVTVRPPSFNDVEIILGPSSIHHLITNVKAPFVLQRNSHNFGIGAWISFVEGPGRGISHLPDIASRIGKKTFPACFHCCH